MTLVERVKSIAKNRKGWNLKETAANAGLGINSIYKWDKQSPSIKSIEAVAKVLGVTVDELKGNVSSNDSSVELSQEHAYSYHGYNVPDKYMKMVKGLMEEDIKDGKVTRHE